MTAGNRRKSTGSPTGMAKRKVIIDAATQVFAERGVAVATVRDIADRADVFSGSLYYYFDSKDQIAEEIVVDYLTRMVEVYRSVLEDATDALDGLRRLIDAAITSLADDRLQVMILQNDWRYLRSMELVAAGTDTIEQVWMTWLERGVAAGELRSDVDPRMMFRTVMGSILAVVRWFNPRGSATVAEVVDSQVRIFLAGVVAPGAGSA